jgi:hypothetical protein
MDRKICAHLSNILYIFAEGQVFQPPSFFGYAMLGASFEQVFDLWRLG